MWKRRGARCSSSSRYSCKQHFVLNFSNLEVYINNQQTYISIGLYAHKSYISNNFTRPSLNTNGGLHCEAYVFEEFPDEILEALLPERFFTKKMKMFSRPDGFLFFGKLGFDFFSTSEWLYPNLKIRLRLIGARPISYMTSDNSNVRPGIDDCSLYTHRIAPRDGNHMEKNDRFACAPVEFNCRETLVKTFIDHTEEFQFIQEIFSNNAPVCRFAFAMNTNSAFNGSYPENPFWFQQFDFRQIGSFRGGQPGVRFDCAFKCSLYITTMKAMNF